MRKILILVMTVALTACASAPTSQEIESADYGQPMTQEECESIVKETMSQYLKDPYSAIYEFGPCTKMAFQSIPVMGIPKQFGYGLSVDINAKNSFGGYAGATRYYFLMKDGQVLRKTKPIDDRMSNQVPF